MEKRELEGKVALVTGASRGLGKAIAIKLGSLGARVAVNYRSSESEAAQTVAQISAANAEATAIKADVTESKEVKLMTRQVVDIYGKIDILVNNAGINSDMLLPRMSDKAWDDVMNTNLRGAYLCIKFALRSMMDQPSGRIINITSLSGIVGNAGQANYSAAKGGLIALTKSTAREVGSRNITVNAIAPGFITSDMTEGLPTETKDEVFNRIPLQRFGTPQDVAELAAFLASDRASYITAQVISVDGGII